MAGRKGACAFTNYRRQCSNVLAVHAQPLESADDGRPARLHGRQCEMDHRPRAVFWRPSTLGDSELLNLVNSRWMMGGGCFCVSLA